MLQIAIIVKNYRNKLMGLVQGLGLIVVLTILAQRLTEYPLLSIMGSMVIAILLGFAWRIVMEVPASADKGINFAAKNFLKIGVVLIGIRLDITQLLASGPKIILLDAIVIVFTITFFWWMGKRLSVTRRLAALIGVGTAVCGASAIAAVAPLIHSDDDETALSVAIIALLGTLEAVIYIIFHPFLNLSPYAYGVLAGSTLHEVGHVVTAAIVGGKSSMEIAVLTKLGRVALLIPVALVMGYLFNRNKKAQGNETPKPVIPWFILGFLTFSLINSLNILAHDVEQTILNVSIILLTMAMAGLGLNVETKLLRRVGTRSLLLGAVGTLALAVLGRSLITLLQIA